MSVVQLLEKENKNLKEKKKKKELGGKFIRFWLTKFHRKEVSKNPFQFFLICL